MMRRPRFILLAASLVVALSSAARAQGLPPAYALSPADQEWVAGISYRDAAVGTLFLAGTALVAGALTGSFVIPAAAAVAAASTFVLVDPSNSHYPSGVAVPTDQELKADGTGLRPPLSGGKP